jgi:hypothetical protein
MSTSVVEEKYGGLPPGPARVAWKVWREIKRPFRRHLTGTGTPNVATLLTPTVGSRATLAAKEKQLFDYLRHSVLPTKAHTFDHYVPSRWIGHQGIELNDSQQLVRLHKWRGDAYQKLYRHLRNDSTINRPFAGRNYLGGSCLHNGWYPTPDAEIYASMIYEHRPDKIVEVGSGYSTLIARRALAFATNEAPLIVIDPAPRTDVEQAADRVIYEPAEARKLDTLGLTNRSLLFIDSSHITRVRGDIPYLFCEILPKLPAGTLVHFHDIFIPYDYPTCYDQLCWTEQYVLHALLANNPRTNVLISTQYLSRHHTGQTQATFGPQVGADNLFYGGSFWIQIRNDQTKHSNHPQTDMSTIATEQTSQVPAQRMPIARKILREIVRPFRGRMPSVPAPPAEVVTTPPVAVEPEPVVAEPPARPFLTGSGADVGGFHPQQATVEPEAIEFVQKLVRQSHKHAGPIIEIGTLLGVTTTNMALAKAHHQKIITVDLYCWNPWGLTPDSHEALTDQVLYYLIKTGQVERIRMDKNEFYATYNGAPPSLVFLDAIHDYPETKKDIEWARTVGARIISGHDYSEEFPGVRQAVDEFGGPRELCASVWAL